MKNVIDLWEQWWNRENSAPLVYAIYPKQSIDRLKPLIKDWMPKSVVSEWDFWKPELMGARALEIAIEKDDPQAINDWVDYMAEYAECYGHGYGGYNFMCPGYGPVCLSAFITGIFRYAEPTVWLEPDTPMTYDEILAAIDNPTPTALQYRKYAMYMIKRVAEHLAGKYIISMPDFGDGMDILASLRHSMHLLTDVYDCPEKIAETLRAIGSFAEDTFKQYSDIITPANQGLSACVMRYLSAKPTYLTYCDFSAMISPDMFDEFVLPTVKRHCANFPGRTVFHLDGPGEIPHVDSICSVEGLFAIQWVKGAGNPGALSECWYDLYRKILDHGKRIAIGAGFDDASFARTKAFFKIFPASEFTLMAHPRNASEASAIREKAMSL